jgi:hypothetical protein
MSITTALLKERISVYQAEKEKAFANYNAFNGAIQACEALIEAAEVSKDVEQPERPLSSTEGEQLDDDNAGNRLRGDERRASSRPRISRRRRAQPDETFE